MLPGRRIYRSLRRGAPPCGPHFLCPNGRLIRRRRQLKYIANSTSSCCLDNWDTDHQTPYLTAGWDSGFDGHCAPNLTTTPANVLHQSMGVSATAPYWPCRSACRANTKTTVTSLQQQCPCMARSTVGHGMDMTKLMTGQR
jgi:hypothetical protein